MGGRRNIGVALCVAISIAAAPAQAADVTRAQDPLRFAPRTSVPQTPCQPGDRPEPGLQGRAPLLGVDAQGVFDAGFALGYNCNLKLIGRFPLSAGSTLDSYENCAYYGRAALAGGTQVLDMSNPAVPLPTDMLYTPAMRDPWESLRVNLKRKLLVGDSNFNTWLDIYDVSKDCRHPRLISSTDMAPAQGHEGWFSPDGMTYYMSKLGPNGTPTLFPIDISDPAHPKRLASWALQAQTHGGMTTEDGKTTFACQQQSPPLDALWILDTSQVAERKADPKPIVRARIDTGDNQWCQNALRVTYRGHPFLIQFGERSGAPDCGRVADNWATFGYPRFYDLADDRAPRLVATAMLASALPQNCGTVKGEGALNGLGYSVHQCSVDRLYDPTILACSWFFSGMRVLDIRDPHHPVELAYYNPGVGTVVGTAPRPIIRSDRHEIWFGNDTGGFYAVRFENNVWPFAGSARCPEFDDYYFAQYNPGSSCPTANTNGIGKPAPGLTWGAKLTRVSVGRVRPGGRSRVRFTLSAMSELTLEVRRGGRRVTKRVIDVGAGRGSVLLPALTRGRYTITVKPAGGRTTRLGLTVR